MKRFFLNHLLWILLLCSCNNQVEVECICFDLDGELHNIHQTGLLSGLQVVPMETQDSVLIGNIRVYIE